MPPKFQTKKVARKPKKEPTSLDDVDTVTLTQEKLQEFCIRVNEALSKERQYNNFLRLDRDKVTDMVAISREHLIDARHRNRIKVIEMDSSETNHRLIMGQNRQKLINLLIEKNKECVHTKLETHSKLLREGKCHEERLDEITSDIRTIQLQENELERNVEEQISSLQVAHAEKTCNLRDKNREMMAFEENNYEKNFNKETTRLQEMFEKEQSEFVASKNKEKARLLKCQTKFMTELKHYYNKIVHNNMSVMMAMKMSQQELKSTLALIDHQLLKLTADNKLILDTVTSLRNDESELRNILLYAQSDHNELLYTMGRLCYHKHVLESSKWTLETLNIADERQNRDLREIKENKQSHLLDLEVKIEEFNMILERILRHVLLRMNDVDSAFAIIRQNPRQEGKWNKQLESAHLLQDTSMDDVNSQLSSVSVTPQ